ncbi:MAG: AAC(3) family N-acetyltransferase [Chloroflexota bacterium]
MSTVVTMEDVRQAVRRLGLPDRPLEVHASLRSFGWVGGGARSVVDAFLAEGCTVLVPTFSDAFFVALPPDQRPERNAIDYDRPLEPWQGAAAERVFTRQSNEYDRGPMGALPGVVLDMPGRVRGDHPVMSFTAVGPLACDLADSQAPMDVYGPLRRLAELDGAVVLIGVELTRMTFLHYAEVLAGRRPFIRWANGPDGHPMEVQYGGCSKGFENLAPSLAHLERVVTVGVSHWRVYSARETLAAAAEAIRQEPEVTFCVKRCGRCADAIADGPLVE